MVNGQKSKVNGQKSIAIHHPTGVLHGHVSLNGSKSISNRALIIMALASADPERWLSNLSTSQDTVTLQSLLSQTDGLYDAGDAGTTYRFLTAFLSIRPGVQTLTGSARMLERPVGPLVDGLRQLGANIDYLDREGYPPLRIGDMKNAEAGRPLVRIPAHVSSQFLSAMLLIAPCLPEGLDLIPEGAAVSGSYLDMTIGMMRHFGADVERSEGRIRVAPGGYQPRPLSVEADWSGASYWYAMVAFAREAEVRLEGLSQTGWQGDSILADMMEPFGVSPQFTETGVLLRKNGRTPPPVFEYNFLNCPDIAQTLAVVCAGLGVSARFSGLETLSIKETDRIKALRTELQKTGVMVTPGAADGSGTGLRIEGKAVFPEQGLLRFDTYGDHRMAMSFAALGMLHAVEIAAPEVVGKSYPNFWKDLERAGFLLEYV